MISTIEAIETYRDIGDERADRYEQHDIQPRRILAPPAMNTYQ